MFIKPKNVVLLPYLLSTAQRNGFAVGAFNPRYTEMITPVLRAGEKMQSPLIIEIAQVELDLYQLTLAEFADKFWQAVAKVKPSVPLGLHLDHTKDFNLIEEAISYGFTSVMIDASEKELQENIATTREVVSYAHARGVAVEAELGRIAAGDSVENRNDEERYTDPQEAEMFIQHTGVDALAVSVGAAHGAYLVRQPKIDLERLRAIRHRTDVNLVLHGGSGTPKEMVKAAIQLSKGGVSKINIATDLEVALFAELGVENRFCEDEFNLLPRAKIAKGALAVQNVVEDKILNFLLSKGKAKDYR